MRHILSALLLILFCCSCSNHYLSPALYKNDVAYQFKPMSSDSVKTANYVSASAYFGWASSGDYTSIASLNLNRAHTFNKFNIAYGVFGFIGDYYNDSIIPGEEGYFSDRLTRGYGGRFSINSFERGHNKDFRVLGLDFTYSQESGPYLDLRQSIKNASQIYTDAGKYLVTAGLTNETIWHLSWQPSTQWGYHAFIGTVFGNHTYTNNNSTDIIDRRYPILNQAVIALSLFGHIKKYTGVVEIQNFSSARWTIGYQF